MGNYLNGARLTDLIAYPPGKQPSDLVTLDELRAANLWPSQRAEPDGWLAWPAESENGFQHLPLYSQGNANPIEPPWLVDFLREEAAIWAGEVIAYGSATAYVAVIPSACCGRAIDVAVTSNKGEVLLHEKLDCPCQRLTGQAFADIAEDFFSLVIWDSKPCNRPLRIGWGMANVLTISTEIRLLAEHRDHQLLRWGRLARGIYLEDAQTWDIFWRCDGEDGDNRRFKIEASTAVDICRAILGRVAQMAQGKLNEHSQANLLAPPFSIDSDEPILLPVRLDREDFQRRSERAEYVYLCQQAEQFEQQGLDLNKGASGSQRRPRSYNAKRAVILRCKDKCENPDCENLGAPSDTSVHGGAILDIDHIDDHARGGRDHPELMIALCPNCHAVKTRGRSRETLREKLRLVAQERHHDWYGM
ncbi:HNH endonuclease signature motif containing protein [Microbispora rosea]|uniref:HNH endonuclease signature motif containing protein n=1 Tax=Microbispora rosea TaxID=58117 RepID=UPI003D8C9DA3